MEKENLVENIAKEFSHGSSVGNLYGEPITAGEKTIIPVAKVAYGFGGGLHARQMRTSAEGQNLMSHQPATDGSGAGGGMYAGPKGVFEITPTSTRFIPAGNAKQLLIGIAIGFLIKLLFFPSRKKASKV